MSGSVRDLVAVGGSAGGVEALKTLVSGLPADLPAAVLLALHLRPTSRSYLADILQRRCPLEVLPARDGLELLPGRVVVAHPDAHLLAVDGHVVLGRGAHENGHRPSHDAMLRSVALARGHRAVGVVVSGLLDDGAAGLGAVARYGGACLVQDPASAEFTAMPTAALRQVPDARTAPLPRLAEEVVRLVTGRPDEQREVDEVQRRRDLAELESALGSVPTDPEGGALGEPWSSPCPSLPGC